MHPKCPKCHHTLINRLVDYCLFCRAQLPTDLRLSENQKEQLKKELLARMEEAKNNKSKNKVTNLENMAIFSGWESPVKSNNS